MTQHSREKALTDRQFNDLVAAADDLDEPFRSETRWILFAAGRLGLRAGELCHVRESWIDWGRRLIQIPRFDACDFGRNREICGYCHDRAEQAAKADEDLTIEQALEERWEPKTVAGARAVPFDFSQRVSDVVEEFFMFYDSFPKSRSAVNRRVDDVLEMAGYPKSLTFPHALRATSATHHAYRGLNAVALQSMHGWEDITTAQKYIRKSGGATQEALNSAHGDD